MTTPAPRSSISALQSLSLSPGFTGSGPKLRSADQNLFAHKYSTYVRESTESGEEQIVSNSKHLILQKENLAGHSVNCPGKGSLLQNLTYLDQNFFQSFSIPCTNCKGSWKYIIMCRIEYHQQILRKIKLFNLQKLHDKCNRDEDPNANLS